MPSIPGVRSRGVILNGLESLPASTEMLVVSSTGSVDSQVIPEATPSVDDYTALLASTEDSVLVTDSLTGGFFVLSEDQSTAQNGGTRIRRSDNSYVDRVWDGKRIRHDWFAVGGVNWVDGTAYNATTGNGVIDIADQVSAAIYVGGDNCVVYGSAITTGKRIYVTRARVTIDGIGVTRANQVSSTLTATAALGVSTITVANGSLFRTGDLVIVSNNTLSNGGLAQDEVSGGYHITSISGNVLTLGGTLNANSGNPTTTYPIGSPVVRVHDLFYFESTAHACIVRNCLFNGNAGNVTLRGWSSQATLNFSTSTIGGIVENCDFHNSPAETIYTPNGLTISNCRAGLCVSGGSALQGSFVHVSDGTSPSYELMHTTIERCFVDTVCQSIALNQHCEGAITYSANVFSPKISNCRFKNGAGGVLSSLAGGATYSIGSEIENSEFEEFAYITVGTLSGSTVLVDSRIRFTHSKFKNCGAFVLQGNNIKRAQGYRGISITDCEFRGNSRIAFRNCADVKIRAVKMDFTSNVEFSTGTTGGATGTWDCGAIAMLDFDRVELSDITIDMPTTYSAGLPVGVSLDITSVSRRKNSGGTDINVLYPQAVRANHIRVKGARYGFTAWRDNNSLGQTYAVADWEINDITVIGPDLTHTPNGTAGVGILVPAGSVCSGLKVYYRYVNLSYLPIIAGGISTGATTATQMGAIVDGWVILGVQGASQIRNFSAGRFGSTSGENVIAINGFSNSSLAMTLGTNTQVEAATSISISGLTTFAGVINEDLFANSGVY